MTDPENLRRILEEARREVDEEWPDSMKHQEPPMQCEAPETEGFDAYWLE